MKKPLVQVRVPHKDGFALGALTIRELRKLLEDDEKREWAERIANSCTRCSKRLATIRWDGGAGRVLCKACGKRENAPVLERAS